MGKYSLSIDQGTTSTKVIVFDIYGNQVIKKQKKCENICIKPGYVEQNVEQIYEDVVYLINECLNLGNIAIEDIAGFGITGIAVGFAAKEAISNVFGSIGLLADRVYKVGDYIAFDTYEGTVSEINFRSTTITTIEGFDVNIPNNLLANNEITNISKAKERRIDLSIDIEYGTSNEKIDRACEILKEIALNDPEIKDNFEAIIDSMAPSSIVVRLIAYTSATAGSQVRRVKSKVIREIIQRYRAEGIEFAFPSMSLYNGDSNVKINN